MLIPLLLTGCFGQPLLGPILAEPRSLVRLDESTELRWLDESQMREPPPGVDLTTWQTHLSRECANEAEPRNGKLLPPLLLPLVPIAAGFAIDALHSALTAESRLYAAQFSTASATGDFWRIGDGGVTQRLVGFELSRFTHNFDDAHPACVIRFAIAPASDNRLLLLRPIFFQTRAARAKLLMFHHGLDTRVDVALSTVSIERTGTLAALPLGSGTLRMADYDLRTAAPRLLRGQTIAVFAAPPISFDAAGRSSNPVLSVRVAVTEHDSARTQETFEQWSGQLQRDRSALIAATSQPVLH